MSEYESLREDIGLVAASLASYSRAVSTHADAVDSAVKELWADQAELRDELHAVANRLEALTRGLTTEPAEVAGTITPGRIYRIDTDRDDTDRDAS